MTRTLRFAAFLVLLFAAVVLTIIGTFFRGPYWGWVWPWDPASPLHTLF